MTTPQKEKCECWDNHEIADVHKDSCGCSCHIGCPCHNGTSNFCGVTNTPYDLPREWQPDGGGGTSPQEDSKEWEEQILRCKKDERSVLTSNPPQHRCDRRGCGKTWFVGDKPPVCEMFDIEAFLKEALTRERQAGRDEAVDAIIRDARPVPGMERCWYFTDGSVIAARTPNKNQS